MSTTDTVSGTIGTTRPLTIKTFLAYGAGDMAGNICFTMAGTFLILYYTNVIGIAGGAIGTMFLVLRFVDAFTDLLMGRAIDAKKPGKRGKLRPIILVFFLPLLVMNWSMYAAAWIFPDQSTTFYTVYMYVTYFLMGSVFYTIVNIAYGAMAPALSQEPSERGKLASFRMFGAAGMILALNWLIAPLISRHEGDPVALQNSLALAIGLVSVVAAALYLFLIWGTKEQVYRSPEPVTLRQSMSALVKNRPLQILSLGSVSFLTGMTVLSTLAAYIALYVQKDAFYIAINATAQTAALFVVGPMIPMIVRRLGKRIGFLVLASFMYLGALILLVSPLESVPLLGTVAFFVMGLGIFGVNTLMWALEADCVEYAEWSVGARTEGTTYAVFSFMRKMGQSLGGAIGGWSLTWAGFNAAAVSAGGDVSDDVARNILLWSIGAIVVATAIGQAVMWFYPLTEVRFAEIVREIRERRGQEGPESESARTGGAAPYVTEHGMAD